MRTLKDEMIDWLQQWEVIHEDTELSLELRPGLNAQDSTKGTQETGRTSLLTEINPSF